MNENEYVAPKGEYVVLKGDTKEQKIMANNLFNNLTQEAKLVLCAIIQAPTELSQVLFGNGKPTKKKLYSYMHIMAEEMGWTLPIIKRTVQELRWFTKEITDAD